MTPTSVTDAQIHLWGANTPDRPWPAGAESRAQRSVPFDVDEVIAEMDGAGVDRAVIVPPSWEGDRNELALAAAVLHPRRLAVMGRVDLRNPAGVDLAHWLEQPGMLGVRLTFHVDMALADAAWLWPAASAAGLPVMVFAPGNTPAVGEVARRYPDLRIIVDHLNLPVTAGAGDIGPTIEPLLPLAELGNVAVKVSALPCASTEGYPFPSLAPHVRRVVDAFGAERCLWGSDLSRLPCPYADWVRAAAEGFGCLSATETEWLMGRALDNWLDWPEPS